MMLPENTQSDPFFNEKKEFERFVLCAKSSKNNDETRISNLVLASKLKNSAVLSSSQSLSDYQNMVDSEVYSHITRRLNELIETVRFYIHKKEYDQAALYLSDMRVLGDFVKSKNIKFNFEFYNKIEDFFKKQKKETRTDIPNF